jgi:hypothetical protein
MPITQGEWESIRNLVLQIAGPKKGEAFVLGQVQKVDAKKQLIWLAEFGDQPIPMLSHEYEVKYYDTRHDGVLVTKKVDVKLKLPKKKQTVLVACEWGTQRLPRCLGILPPGSAWVIEEDE